MLKKEKVSEEGRRSAQEEARVCRWMKDEEGKRGREQKSVGGSRREQKDVEERGNEMM